MHYNFLRIFFLTILTAFFLQADSKLVPGFNQTGFINNNTINGVGTRSTFLIGSAIDSKDRIIVVGTTVDNDGFIMRLNQDGTLDKTFAQTGFINSSSIGGVETNSNIFNKCVVDSQDRIIIVGRKDDPAGPEFCDGFIMRLNQDGTLDTTFNGQGFINSETIGVAETNSFEFNDCALDSQEKIIVIGYTGNGKGLILKLNDNGTLDTNFNPPNGFINDSTIDGEPTDCVALNKCFITQDDKIIIAGYASIQGGDESVGFMLRLHSNGTRDIDFNETGFINTNTINGQTIQAATYQSCVVDDQGNIFFVGRSLEKGVIVKLKSNGVLDTSFNRTGFVNSSIVDGVELDSSNFFSCLLDNQGRLVVAGYSDAGPEIVEGFVMRLNKDGTLDSKFNDVGFIKFTSVKGVAINVRYFKQCILDRWQRLILVGVTIVAQTPYPTVVRLLSNGSLESSAQWTSHNYSQHFKSIQENLSLLG